MQRKHSVQQNQPGIVAANLKVPLLQSKRLSESKELWKKTKEKKNHTYQMFQIDEEQTALFIGNSRKGIIWVNTNERWNEFGELWLVFQFMNGFDEVLITAKSFQVPLLF